MQLPKIVLKITGEHYGGPVAPQGTGEDCRMYTEIVDTVSQGHRDAATTH